MPRPGLPPLGSQATVAYYSLLQRAALCCNMLHSMLQHAVQHAVLCCKMLQSSQYAKQRSAAKRGFDLRLLKLAKAAVSIPIIASSGAGAREYPYPDPYPDSDPYPDPYLYSAYTQPVIAKLSEKIGHGKLRSHLSLLLL
jgi:hypothetical protein